MKKKILVGVVTLLAVATLVWAGIQDRFSKIELEKDPYNRINIPEITAPTSNPLSNHGWLYVKDSSGVSNLYFEGDGGVVTSLSGAINNMASVGFSSNTTIYHTSIDLTRAEIILLETPHELVTAAGADKLIEVVSAVLILDYGTNVLAEVADNLVIEYETSGDDITAAIEMTGFIDQSADTIMAVAPSNPLAANAATDMVNKGIMLHNPDDNFTGNAAADTVLTIKIAYRVHTAGL